MPSSFDRWVDTVTPIHSKLLYPTKREEHRVTGQPWPARWTEEWFVRDHRRAQAEVIATDQRLARWLSRHGEREAPLLDLFSGSGTVVVPQVLDGVIPEVTLVNRPNSLMVEAVNQSVARLNLQQRVHQLLLELGPDTPPDALPPIRQTSVLMTGLAMPAVLPNERVNSTAWHNIESPVEGAVLELKHVLALLSAAEREVLVVEYARRELPVDRLLPQATAMIHEAAEEVGDGWAVQDVRSYANFLIARVVH